MREKFDYFIHERSSDCVTLIMRPVHFALHMLHYACNDDDCNVKEALISLQNCATFSPLGGDCLTFSDAINFKIQGFRD